MLAPLSKKYFLLIICLSSLCKVLCGITAGAVNSAILSHFGSEHQVIVIMIIIVIVIIIIVIMMIIPMILILLNNTKNTNTNTNTNKECR